MPEALLRRGRQLEGLQRPDRHPRARRAAVLQELHRPVHPHRPRADRQGPRARPTRATSTADVTTGTLPSGLLDHAAAGRVRAPGRAAGVRRVPRPADPEHPRLQPRRSGRRPCSSSIYDENGGFFDHVPPPTAPAGTAGEYLTDPLPSGAGGIAGPIGLGFRTPCLVISPFSARRLQVLGHPGPHLDAAPDRDAVRRHGAEPDRLAPLRHRRLHRRAQPHRAAGHRGPVAAVHLDRQQPHGRRGGGAQRPRPAPWTSASPTRCPRATRCRPRKRPRPAPRSRSCPAARPRLPIHPERARGSSGGTGD